MVQVVVSGLSISKISKIVIFLYRNAGFDIVHASILFFQGRWSFLSFSYPCGGYPGMRRIKDQ